MSRRDVARNTVAITLASFAAYAISFALDLLFGALLGVYPGTAYLPSVVWNVGGLAALTVALRLAPPRLYLTIPFLLFGGLALFGGLVGHRHSLLVGIGTLACVPLSRARQKRQLSLPAP
jgi:hypothetical protein